MTANHLAEHNKARRREIEAVRDRQIAAHSAAATRAVAEAPLPALERRIAEALSARWGKGRLTPTFDIVERARHGGDVALRFPQLLKDGGPKAVIRDHLPWIVEVLRGPDLADAISGVDTAGMYVNVTLADRWLLESAGAAAERGRRLLPQRRVARPRRGGRLFLAQRRQDAARRPHPLDHRRPRAVEPRRGLRCAGAPGQPHQRFRRLRLHAGGLGPVCRRTVHTRERQRKIASNLPDPPCAGARGRSEGAGRGACADRGRISATLLPGCRERRGAGRSVCRLRLGLRRTLCRVGGGRAARSRAVARHGRLEPDRVRPLLRQPQHQVRSRHRRELLLPGRGRLRRAMPRRRHGKGVHGRACRRRHRHDRREARGKEDCRTRARQPRRRRAQGRRRRRRAARSRRAHGGAPRRRAQHLCYPATSGPSRCAARSSP